jgi:hypothetical protein
LEKRLTGVGIPVAIGVFVVWLVVVGAVDLPEPGERSVDR